MLIGAAWQRCRVHFLRNVLGHSPEGLGRDGRRRHPHDLRPARRRRGRASSSTRSPRCSAASSPPSRPCSRDAAADVLAFTAFPPAHWRKIWSTNPLERVNKEIKRRTDVVGIFPNEAAVVAPRRRVLLEVHDEWQVADRRYLSEGSMAQLYEIDNDDGHTKEVDREPTSCSPDNE